MGVTEAEAKTKWCPMARVCAAENDTTTEPAHMGYNRVYIRSYADDGTDQENFTNPLIARCIGSACMMWRWHEPWTSSTQEGHGGDLVLRLKRKPGEPKRGYCGLAGVPT